MKRRAIAFLFFLSGFCGLTYQIVWVRLAFSQFGIITPVLSIVLSTFMLGLALGSWLGGRWIAEWSRATKLSPIYFYAVDEWLIGLGAILVPKLFLAGGRWLLQAGEMNSLSFLSWSALLLAVAILPWCIFMGATFPLMMAYLKEEPRTETTSFSFLYTANVLGALTGTVLTALALIELYGFQATLGIAGVANGIIGLGAIMIGRQSAAVAKPKTPERARKTGVARATDLYLVLFSTGLIAMALEVVWTRAFTMILKNTIYSFAMILTVYLLATWAGSTLCRHVKISLANLFAGLAASAFLPIVLNDPRLMSGPFHIALSLFPLCAVLGYLTPHLIDRISEGDPNRAGRAYALNTLGCILGPLVASYFLLPHMGVRAAMVVLTLPFIAMTAYYRQGLSRGGAWTLGSLTAALLACSILVSKSYEEVFLLVFHQATFRRDYTATVVSCGQGMHKQLFVNGIPMTTQTPITKVMAHLPLALLPHRPESALMICFGMGTTFRSLLTWDIHATSVELVPSVKAAFPYYFADAEDVLRNPLGHVVIDDGRRYMARRPARYDLITLDPPPPIEAAGSSLLYSKEFYALAKERLAPGGILQQWIPGADASTFHAATRSLVEAFPYVKVFQSTGGFGYHFLASMQPIAVPSTGEFIRRLPPKARRDFMEWESGSDLNGAVSRLLHNERDIKDFIVRDSTLYISDDRPYNEYYVLHHWRDERRGTLRIIQ